MSSMMKQVRLFEASMIHLGKIFSGVSIGRKMRASHKVEPHGINLQEHKIRTKTIVLAMQVLIPY